MNRSTNSTFFLYMPRNFDTQHFSMFCHQNFIFHRCGDSKPVGLESLAVAFDPFLSINRYFTTFLRSFANERLARSQPFCLHSGVFPAIFSISHFTVHRNDDNVELNFVFGMALTIYSRNISICFVYIKFLAWFHRTIEEKWERKREREKRVWKNVISNSNSIQLATTSYCHTCNAYRISIQFLLQFGSSYSAPVLSHQV